MNFKSAAIFLILASAAAGLVSYFSGLGYWLVFAIVVAAFLINGFVAVVEDDLPGGFNNPDGTDTPAYISKVTWVIRGVGLLALGLIAFSLVLWGLD